MGKIGHGYGSKWHLLRYLGYHRTCFNDQVIDLLKCQSLAWLDFRFLPPNKSDKHDGEHIGVSFLDNDHTKAASAFSRHKGAFSLAADTR